MSADLDPDFPVSSDFVARLKGALATGHHRGVEALLGGLGANPNAIVELSNDDWMKDPTVPLPPAVLLGLWPLEYRRELTSPLRIAAAHGYMDCLRSLLEHGAWPDLAPGGRSALHDACENGKADCAELLLEHGASPDLLSEDGLSPLHLCRTAQSLRCAKVLFLHGAQVDPLSGEEEETPLHVAAKHSLPHHTDLYLHHGADVNRTSVSGETPLGAACAGTQSPKDRLRLCHQLLAHDADVNMADHDGRSPLHKAARNLHHSLVVLLLEHQADVSALDYNGTSPLSSALQSVAVRKGEEPHLVVRTLLNHGASQVWSPALPKVLAICASSPKTVEVLVNSFTQVPVTNKWVESVPETVLQAHQPFYQSLFALGQGPRCLQHLCRSAIRGRCGKDCHRLVPQLPISKLLQRYLLLEPGGTIC